MKTINYFVFLLVTLISFLGTLVLVVGLGGYAYLLEMFILLVLAVIAFMVFYGFNLNASWANLLATGMFALYLLNLLLIYFLREVGLLFTATLVIVLVGFSLAAFERRRTPDYDKIAAEIDTEAKRLEEAFKAAEKPQVIVEDLKPKKKAVKKRPKKSVKKKAKKPAKKKAAKKKTSKKPKKKAKK